MGAIRVIVFLVLAAGAGLGAWWYMANGPTGLTDKPPVGATAPTPVVERPGAAQCGGLDAVYAARENKKLTIRWQTWDTYSVPNALLANFPPYAAGALTMMVTEPSGKTRRFAVLSAKGYMRNFVFPLNARNSVSVPAAQDWIELIQLDKMYQTYLPLPVGDSRAYDILLLPGLARYLHPAMNRGGETIVATTMFDFVACEPKTPAKSEDPIPPHNSTDPEAR
jgi:hypothetical protein